MELVLVFSYLLVSMIWRVVSCLGEQLSAFSSCLCSYARLCGQGVVLVTRTDSAHDTPMQQRISRNSYVEQWHRHDRSISDIRYVAFRANYRSALVKKFLVLRTHIYH